MSSVRTPLLCFDREREKRIDGQLWCSSSAAALTHDSEEQWELRAVCWKTFYISGTQPNELHIGFCFDVDRFCFDVL